MINKKKPCKDPNNTEDGKLCYYFTKKFGCKDCSAKYKPKTKTKKVRQKIKQVSSKRARMNQAYTILRRLFLEQNPKCEVYPNLNATEIHHKMKRNGERLLDSTLWMAVSREGHLYIHANPKESYEKEWLIKG